MNEVGVKKTFGWQGLRRNCRGPLLLVMGRFSRCDVRLDAQGECTVLDVLWDRADGCGTHRNVDTAWLARMPSGDVARARSPLGDDVQLIEAILLNLGPLQCSTQRPRTSMASTT